MFSQKSALLANMRDKTSAVAAVTLGRAYRFDKPRLCHADGCMSDASPTFQS
jgi:hypothetical protein